MIAPYYQQPGITLYHDDCLPVLTGMQQNTVDLVVTSPPFNADMPYEVGLWSTLAEFRQWLITRFAALWRVCRSGAWVVIELQDLHVSPEHSHHLPNQKEQFNMATAAHLTVAMEQLGWYYKGEAIWARGRWINNARLYCAPGSPAILTQHSKVLFFRKPGGRKGVYQYPHMSNEWLALWARSVWEHINPINDPLHPAPMPYAMAYGIIQGWSVPGSVVLDPFMGRGTTLRAAMDLDRIGIGIDKELDHCVNAITRLRQVPMILDCENSGVPL